MTYLIPSAEMPLRKLMGQLETAYYTARKGANPIPWSYYREEALARDFSANPALYLDWRIASTGLANFSMQVTVQRYAMLYGIRVNPKDVPITRMEIAALSGAPRIKLAPHKLYVPTGLEDQYDATGYLVEPLFMEPLTIWQFEGEYLHAPNGVTTLLLLALVAD